MTDESNTAPSAVTAPATATAERKDVLREDAGDFVARLKELDKGELAALRRNAGEVLPGRGTAWFPGLLRSGLSRRYAEIYFLTATLYDLNRKPPVPGDFGRSVRRLATPTNEKAIKRRFHILLDATFDQIFDPADEAAPYQVGGGEMAFRLRQMVKLCAAHEVGIDWPQLLADLCRWEMPGKRIQKKWARSFFGDLSNDSAGALDEAAPGSD